jgi:toxin FitB
MNRLSWWSRTAVAAFALGLSACAQVWGRLRVAHPENALDKQIAATALIHDLEVVTRDAAHYRPTGVRVLNPFSRVGVD